MLIPNGVLGIYGAMLEPQAQIVAISLDIGWWPSSLTVTNTLIPKQVNYPDDTPVARTFQFLTYGVPQGVNTIVHVLYRPKREEFDELPEEMKKFIIKGGLLLSDFVTGVRRQTPDYPLLSEIINYPQSEEGLKKAERILSNYYEVDHNLIETIEVNKTNVNSENNQNG